MFAGSLPVFTWYAANVRNFTLGVRSCFKPERAYVTGADWYAWEATEARGFVAPNCLQRRDMAIASAICLEK